MAQLNDLLVLGDTNLQGDVVSQSNITAPKFIGALQGNADTATALTSNAGSANTPIYFANGKPTACSYTLAKSVPADAEFTDTVYTLPKATSSTLGGVKIGSNITVSSGTISLTKANVTSALGYTPPTTDTDTGATSVEVTGSGSAVTAASYDAATRKLTLTKGSTFNNYSLPTATTSALGGVKAGATITSSSGYTACPILNGVLYYKDTKYTLSSFDITATATELNYTDGVTSNIQTQLDNKLPLSGGTVTGNILFSNSSTQPNQPNLKWKTIKNNSNVDRTPYVGYCTSSTDGTFMVGSLEGTDYTKGLAIGGSSGNLLWKSKPVATTDQIPTSLKNPNSLTVKGNGTQSFTYDGSTAKTLNIKAGTNTSVTSDTSGNITIAATDTTYTAGTGLTLSGTDFRVTASDASEIMNQLSEGSSPALPDDYLIAQYAGGGSTTKTYHRRKVKNIITGDNVKAALGTGTETTKFLRNDGTWQVPTDSHGNDIAQTYLTVQSHDLNPSYISGRSSMTFPLKGTNVLVNLSRTAVQTLSVYISRDNGNTWTLLSDSNYKMNSHGWTLGRGYYYDPSLKELLIYNIQGVNDNKYYYTVITKDTTSLNLKLQIHPSTGAKSGVAWFSAILFQDKIAAVYDTMDTHEIGVIKASSHYLCYGCSKTGSASYSVMHIGVNCIDSASNYKTYFYFFCDYNGETAANKQRIYRILETFSYSTYENTYANTTLTSGYSSQISVESLRQVGMNSFVYVPYVLAEYNSGTAYFRNTIASVSNATYTAITLPEYISFINVVPLEFDQTFIITGCGYGGGNVSYLVDLKGAIYDDGAGGMYQTTGIYTPKRIHNLSPVGYWESSHNGGECLFSYGQWYLSSENYQYARTKKNEIYCNGTKLGEFYQ